MNETSVFKEYSFMLGHNTDPSDLKEGRVCLDRRSGVVMSRKNMAIWPVETGVVERLRNTDENIDFNTSASSIDGHGQNTETDNGTMS